MLSRTFPEAVPDISAIATVLADRSRAAMCAALMDGRAWTVGELGAYAGLARSTATEHVGVLVGRGIAVDTRQGRHRYISLAGDDIARVIEALGVVTEDTLPTPPSLNAWTANKQLRQGRTCYKHLAGRLGVGLTARFRPRPRRPELAADAERRRAPDHLGRPAGREQTENLVTPCMDSTERRFHLAGPLGTAICRIFFSRGWLERLGATRAVRLTPAGGAILRDAGLDPGEYGSAL